MEHFIWSLKSGQIVSRYQAISYFLVAVFLYRYTNVVYGAFMYLMEKLRGRDRYFDLPRERQLPAVIVVPTLMRNESELEGLKGTIRSAVQNGYPGDVTIIPSIDGYKEYNDLFLQLDNFLSELKMPKNFRYYLTGNENRSGKAVAIDSAIEKIESLHKAGEIPELPKIMFCLDADSVVGPDALKRMVFCITKKSIFTGKLPTIVNVNVKIIRSQYWSGIPNFFTSKGFLGLSIASEYLRVSMAKFNAGLIPVSVASGALYCTWFKIPQTAPKFAGFLESLKWSDCLKWWLGSAPPKFDGRAPALPHALAGEGDDTWMTLLALSLTWKNGELSFQLPRTPLHALVRFFSKLIFRPMAYDPKAQVFTKSPTTPKSLFQQRMRWNIKSHVNLRWRKAYGYLVNLHYFFATTKLVLGYFAYVLYKMVFPQLRPFSGHHLDWQDVVWLSYFMSVAINMVEMFLMTIFESDFRQWHKFLLVPFLPIYQFIFNVIPGIVGNIQDVFLFGSNRGFAPEKTLKRGKTIRIALAFRLRRAVINSLRSLRGDPIPWGSFWFGWRANRWNYGGYEGWDARKRPSLSAEFNRDFRGREEGY